jgi:hypothetical protein
LRVKPAELGAAVGKLTGLQELHLNRWGGMAAISSSVRVCRVCICPSMPVSCVQFTQYDRLPVPCIMTLWPAAVSGVRMLALFSLAVHWPHDVMAAVCTHHPCHSPCLHAMQCRIV